MSMKTYKDLWGNYKSDRHKTKGVLKEKIRDLLVHAPLNKFNLIQIKSLILEIAKGNEVATFIKQGRFLKEISESEYHRKIIKNG